MHLSQAKLEAVQDICGLDESQQAWSYWLPILRFHARWQSLDREDFTKAELSAHEGLMGYAIQNEYCGADWFAPFAEGDSDETAPIVARMEEYLDKITGLCKENNIALILVKTPTVTENIERYNAAWQYANEHDLVFLDMNESNVYDIELGYDYANDNADHEHANAWGAQKITSYIGNVLVSDYGLEARDDEQWDQGDTYYQQRLADCELTHIDDPQTYLQALSNDRYSIFVSIPKWEGYAPLQESTVEEANKLGFSIVPEMTEGYAALSGGRLVESSVSMTGTILDGCVPYRLTAGQAIEVGGQTIPMKQSGLLIAVYANDLCHVVDSSIITSSAQGDSIAHNAMDEWE